MRMEGLIDALLGYSRLRRHEVSLRIVDATPIAERAAVEVRLRLGDIATIDIAPPLMPVLAEPVVLEQMLTNLIGNAAKFQRDGLPVHVAVRTEQRGGRVRLWVEDNGIGIAPEHQERIFNVFERLHGEQAYPGTGIGLAIVKEGVELMGGACGVDSELGQGSRFWVELAAAPDAAGQEARHP